jgi:peroxiredoxin Q/BCP
VEKKILKKYGVWQLKKMYGREYYGVVRTTYLIDPEGRIVYVWKRVKVKGHVDGVLKKLKELVEGGE